MPYIAHSANTLRYIYHHVFFPPKLLQEDDSAIHEDKGLLDSLLDALVSFQANLNDSDKLACKVTIDMLRVHQDLLNESSSIDSRKVAAKLSSLKPQDCLALHVRAQNAGVIIQRQPNETTFYLFEVSPTSKAVTETQGRLSQCFPNTAIAICNDRFDEGGHFVNAIVELLASLHEETPEEVMPTSTKAGVEVIETRETVNPRLITELFKDMLHGLGHHAEMKQFYKHTRDEVHWKSALNPWRRSSSWLFIRVAMRISLNTVDNSGRGEFWYKSIMLYALSHFAGLALHANLDSGNPWLKRIALYLKVSFIWKISHAVRRTLLDTFADVSEGLFSSTVI